MKTFKLFFRMIKRVTSSKTSHMSLAKNLVDNVVVGVGFVF